MTNEHKAVLAVGRTESRIVRDYLDALRSNRPKRGRKRTSNTIAARLKSIADQLADADPLTELKLVQERMDLEIELLTKDAGVDLSALEAEFVKVAKNYSDRQGTSYGAWRSVGIEPAVLQKAGISR